MGEVSNGEVTTEHLKSHLQKYRTNSERSKKEFLAMYEKRMEASSAADSTNGPSSTTDDPKEDDSGKESKSLNPSFSTYPIGFSTPVAANKSSFKSSKMENSLPLLPNDRQLFLQTHQRQQALMELQNKLNVHFQEQSKLRQELQASWSPLILNTPRTKHCPLVRKNRSEPGACLSITIITSNE